MLKTAINQFKQAFRWLRKEVTNQPLFSFLIIFLLGWLLWTIWATYKANNLGFENKTLWDWMQLLIVPIVLGLGAYILTDSQQKNEQKIAQRDRKEEISLARDRQRQAMLEAYFDRMTELLLKENLRKSAINDDVRSIARTITLTALYELNVERVEMLFRFMHDAELENIITFADANLKKMNWHGILLDKANLSEAQMQEIDLSGAYLDEANLKRTILRGANLSNAQMKKVDLSDALLEGANLSRAILHQANLTDAYLNGGILTEAYLIEAKISGANLSGAFLSETSLNGANMNDTLLIKVNLRKADLSKTFLNNAILSGADLTEAKLTGAVLKKANLHEALLINTNLKGADLSGAKLTGAFMRGADLSKALLINADLSGADLSDIILTEAVMPDGTQYEAWIERHPEGLQVLSN